MAKHPPKKRWTHSDFLISMKGKRVKLHYLNGGFEYAFLIDFDRYTIAVLPTKTKRETVIFKSAISRIEEAGSDEE